MRIRDVVRQLRFPFSVHLAPVFLFALSQVPPAARGGRAWAVFLILHVLVYPASNGFNSYYDRDEGPIGELERPPPVSSALLWVSLAMDAVALLAAVTISPAFAAMVFVYGAASKAYSHPAFRWKKFAWRGWCTVVCFQGAFVYLMTLGTLDPTAVGSPAAFAAAGLASLWVGAGYPLTQIFQHEEDARRGDRTLSLRLGVRGTFLFSAILLGLTQLGFLAYFAWMGHLESFAVVAGLGLLPALYFVGWMRACRRDAACADWRRAMRMSRMGSFALNAAFLILTFVPFSAHAVEVRVFKLEKPAKSPAGIGFALPYTLGTHTGRALDAEGEVNVEWPALKVIGGRFRVAVLDIDTGSAKMNCHLQESLGLDYTVSDFPKTHVCDSDHKLPVIGKDSLAYSWITLTNIVSDGEAPTFDGKPLTLALRGQWNVHGVTRELKFPLELSTDPSDPQLIRVKGEIPFRLEEYGVQVKPFLFIKVKDEARVSLDLRFRRKT